MSAASQGAATGATMAAQGEEKPWYSLDSLKNTFGLSSDPNEDVERAQAAVDKANSDLEKAKREAAAAATQPAKENMGGGRRRTRRSTRRSKRSKKSKRSKRTRR